MRYTENGCVRDTPEYEEARMLLMDRAVLRREMLITDAQIKRLHRVSHAAVRLAEADAQQGLPSISAPELHKISAGNEVNIASSSASLQDSCESPFRKKAVFHWKELPTGCHDLSLDRFYAALERKIPWEKLTDLIGPLYAKRGLPPAPGYVRSMVKLYLLQKWCSLRDEALMQRLRDCPVTNKFVGLEPPSGILINSAALAVFKCLLEWSGLENEVSDVISESLFFGDESTQFGT